MLSGLELYPRWVPLTYAKLVNNSAIIACIIPCLFEFNGVPTPNLGKPSEASTNLVPRVLSLLRESTLVTAGHVSKHANLSRTGGGAST